MADIPLTRADQALASTLAALALQRVPDARSPDLVAMLGDLVAEANPSAPYMAPVIAAARAVRDAAGKRYMGSGAPVWARAMLDASAAAHDFFTWRAALAFEAHRASKTEGAVT